MIRPRDLPALAWDFVSAAGVFAVIVTPRSFAHLTVATTVYGLLLLEPLAGASTAAVGHALREFGLAARTWTIAFLLTFLIVMLAWIVEAGAEVPGLFVAALWLTAGKLSIGLQADLDLKRRGELMWGVGVLTGVAWLAYLLLMIAVAKTFGFWVTNDRGETVVDRHSVGAAWCGAAYFVALGVGRLVLRRRVAQRR